MANIKVTDLQNSETILSLSDITHTPHIIGGCGISNGGKDLDLDGCNNSQTRKLIRLYERLNKA